MTLTAANSTAQHNITMLMALLGPAVKHATGRPLFCVKFSYKTQYENWTRYDISISFDKINVSRISYFNWSYELYGRTKNFMVTFSIKFGRVISCFCWNVYTKRMTIPKL